MGLGVPTVSGEVLVYREVESGLIGAWESGNAPIPTDPPTPWTIYMVGPDGSYHPYSGADTLDAEWAALGSHTLNADQVP